MVNGDEIKRRRLEATLTIQEAAARAGWKQHSRWSDIEGGRVKDPGVLSMQAVARVLGCRVDDLLSEAKAKKRKG